MYNLKFSETAVKNLEKFNKVDQKLIAKKLIYLSENFDTLKNSKKITELKGNKTYYRFVIARKIRAIFEVNNNELILLILKIGKRKNIYK